MDYVIRLVESRTVDKPWGFELVHVFRTLNQGEFVLKVLGVRPNSKLSKQFHETKEEVIIKINQCSTDNSYVIADEDEGSETSNKAFNISHILPDTIHRIVNEDDEEWSFFAEVSTNHLDDVVRVEDEYNRLNESE